MGGIVSYYEELRAKLLGYVRQAEALAGKRDGSWEIGDIRFCRTGPRMIPDFVHKVAAVELSVDCAADDDQARLQLSHEALHLLSPIEHSTIFEEGLAGVLQHNVICNENLVNWVGDHRYVIARELVRPWLKKHPDGAATLRLDQGHLSVTEPKALTEHFPGMPGEVAEVLTRQWKDFGVSTDPRRL